VKLKFTFKQMDSMESIKEYAELKSEKLSKFIQHPIDLHYFFSEEHGKFHTEMTLLADHNKYVSTGVDSSEETSVDMATEKMVAQLRKHKSKVQHYH